MKILTWLEKHNKLSWFLTIFSVITIFILSSFTFNLSAYPDQITKDISFLTITYHFMAFFCLSLFFTISWTKGKPNPKTFSICFLLCVIYALTDEIHQFFVPGRFLDVQDIRIDVLGIGVAQLIYTFHLIKKLLLKSDRKDLYSKKDINIELKGGSKSNG